MPYAYAVLWFAIGLILIISLSKENKIFIFAGIFFMLLGGYWLADALLPDIDLFSGSWGIGFKVVCGVALIIFLLIFLREGRKGAKKAKDDKKED